jgi:poly(A) polymerase
MAEVAAAWHGAAEAPAPAQLREQLFLHGAQSARDGLALVQAESQASPTDEGFRAADAFLRDTPAPKPPFAAADLIARGVRQGAGLGAALKRLQAAWIRAGFPHDPKRIAALIDAACDAPPPDPEARESGWTRPRP